MDFRYDPARRITFLSSNPSLAWSSPIPSRLMEDADAPSLTSSDMSYSYIYSCISKHTLCLPTLRCSNHCFGHRERSKGRQLTSQSLSLFPCLGTIEYVIFEELADYLARTVLFPGNCRQCLPRDFIYTVMSLNFDI